MSDTAKLREALDAHEQQVGVMLGSPGHKVALMVIDAARELLTIREAGALIITPDEDGWPEWATAGHRVEWPSASPSWIPEHAIRSLLDALRDAKPDGET